MGRWAVGDGLGDGAAVVRQSRPHHGRHGGGQRLCGTGVVGFGLWAALAGDGAAGDRLTFYIDAEGKGHFWWQDKPLGTLADPQFSAAFLAIWLADNSRDPALTRRLRGQS